MANKPVPQDHKPKEDKAKAEKTVGQFRLSADYDYREVEGWDISYDGFELFMPQESLSDYFVQENMAKMRSEGNSGAWRYPLILERLFGAEQKAALLEHVTDKKTGRPDSEKIGSYIKVVFEAAAPNG